jgi:uncharacterized membrane protein YcaP (DUF421 family)
MWNDLTHLSVAPLDLVVRGVVVFFAILLLLRISGKRQMGQMSATEFIAILLISNAVQNAMNAGDNSLVGGLILASVLIFCSWLISLLTFLSPRMSKIFEGTPTLLVHKGETLSANLKKERMTLTELKILLRKQGIHNMSDIHSAILEADGTLSVTHNDEITQKSH